jgi:hypothetical protein
VKLEPIFLAPRPIPKSMPTRRAWLLAGCAFAAGAVTGSACQSWFGAPSAGTPPAPLDPTHAWLRRICDDATPIEELLKHRLLLYLHIAKWRDDAMLWHGIDRLENTILSRIELADRRRMANELVLFLDRTQVKPADARSRWDLDGLRAIAGGR